MFIIRLSNLYTYKLSKLIMSMLFANVSILANALKPLKKCLKKKKIKMTLSKIYK